MMELKNICKSFQNGLNGETVLFKDFNFSLATGQFVAVVGSNGSGKTTMLNLMAGSLLPDRGEILLDGTDITLNKEFVRSKKIGRVFQDPGKGVAPFMTLAENLSLAENKGRPFGLTKGLSKARLNAYRDMVAPIGLGLEDKMNVPMGLLSGGQRQAVSLIMATMVPIELLILDEHTAALDPKTSDSIMQLTDRIVREKGLTAIMVTHNLRYAVEYGNRMVMMHDGKIVLDKAGTEKEQTSVNDLLSLFNSISIECGN